MPNLTYICPICQKEFQRPSYRHNVSTCSRTCKEKQWTVSISIPSNCPVCKKEFIYKQYPTSKPKLTPCCSRLCSSILQGGKPSKDVWDRFWSKVDIRSINECWEWKDYVRPDGYARFRIGDRMVLAHRVSYTLIFGEIPDELKICHKCDNRKCQNWHHHFLGTQKDNVADAIRKGRMFWSKKAA